MAVTVLRHHCPTASAAAADLVFGFVVPTGSHTTAANPRSSPPPKRPRLAIRLCCRAGASLTHVCMFRGYVDHGQVRETIRRRQPSRLISSLIPSFGASADKARPGDTPKPPQPRPQSYFIRMNGPRGRGRAEVAVSTRPANTSAPAGENPDNPSYSTAGTGTAHSAHKGVARGGSAGGDGADGAAVATGEGLPGGAGSGDGAVDGDRQRRRSGGQRGLLGSFTRAARAFGRAVGQPEAAAAEATDAPQFECRFICLMLAVEDIVTALLGLHTI